MLVALRSRRELAKVRPLDALRKLAAYLWRERPAPRRGMPLAHAGCRERAPAERRLGDAASEVLGGLHVARRQHPAAGTRLRHRPQMTSEAIEIVVRIVGAGIGRRQPEPHPDHSML